MDAPAQQPDSSEHDLAVSLVIPGRDCAHTLRPCLDALVPILHQSNSPLKEIIFVNDGSRDDTPAIAASYGDDVRVITGGGDGAATARNRGWRAAEHDLIWFVDSDCVAEPDALERLLPAMSDPETGGVSGSYGNRNPHSLLARLIHEEIIDRHSRMGDTVDFLATFNVLYRREALVKVNGFDPRYRQAEDAELAFRVADAGYQLRFVIDSRVHHFHETRWLRHFRTQWQQGYWRVWLHLEHRGHSTGDSYSSLFDHLQPPLAMCTLASLVAAAIGSVATDATTRTMLLILPAVLLVLLLCAQIPLASRLIRRTGNFDMAAFAVMNTLRAFWRGLGMTRGTIDYILGKHQRPQEDVAT